MYVGRGLSLLEMLHKVAIAYLGLCVTLALERCSVNCMICGRSLVEFPSDGCIRLDSGVKPSQD